MMKKKQQLDERIKDLSVKGEKSENKNQHTKTINTLISEMNVLEKQRDKLNHTLL